MPATRKSTPYSKNGDKPRYVYALVDPRDSRIRYVGCSYDPEKRTANHRHTAAQAAPWKLFHDPTRAVSPAWEWLYHLHQNNERPIVVILEECNSDNWREKENDWILKLHEAGAELTNMRTIAGYDNIEHENYKRKGHKAHHILRLVFTDAGVHTEEFTPSSN